MLTPESVLQSRYRIVRQLGQGGMGAVYEAIDERLDSTVALKETFFVDERLRKQFEREARLLARMHHPALPRVSDHFSESEGQFLVMQFIGGDDLAEMSAKRRGPFPVEQVLTWADQLLDALDYLHTQDPQIIHRDIKPQNLKLTPRGQVILLDFGLAKGQAGEISRPTTSASIFGYTPNYAPLEQIQGLGTDARSDIYALAATLYHLMTGVKPPDALSRAAAIVNGQPDPLMPAHEVNSSIPAGASAVLQKAMAQNRDQRYATAAEMRRALGAGSETTVANRSEARTVLFAPSSSPVAAETRAEAPQATVQTGETTVVRQPGQTRRKTPAIAAAAALVLIAAIGGLYAYKRSNSATVESPAIQQVTTPAGESTPAVEQTAATPTAPQESKAPEQNSAVAAEEKVVKKPERTTKQKAATSRQGNASDEEDDERATSEVQEPPERPDVPDVNAGDVPRPRRPPARRRVGDVTIRTLADGTQVIINPDGSRIIVTPDGRRQIIRPNPRIYRRGIPPRQ